jgi:hypothetical protein
LEFTADCSLEVGVGDVDDLGVGGDAEDKEEE